MLGAEGGEFEIGRIKQLKSEIAKSQIGPGRPTRLVGSEILRFRIWVLGSSFSKFSSRLCPVDPETHLRSAATRLLHYRADV